MVSSDEVIPGVPNNDDHELFEDSPMEMDDTQHEETRTRGRPCYQTANEPVCDYGI